MDNIARNYEYAVCRADRIGVIGFTHTLEEAVKMRDEAPVLCDIVTYHGNDAILADVYNWNGKLVSAYPQYENEG